MVWFDICFFDGVIGVILQLIFSLGKIRRGIKTALKIIVFGSTILKILTLFYIITALFLIASTGATAVPVMSTLKSSSSSVFDLCVTRSDFTAGRTIDVNQSDFTGVITILLTCHCWIHLTIQIKIRLSLGRFIIFTVRSLFSRMEETRIVTTL